MENAATESRQLEAVEPRAAPSLDPGSEDSSGSDTVAEHDDEATWKAFKDAVNMTASALEKFLDTDESQEVGQKSGGKGESTGHASGRRIVELLHTKKADLTEDDYAHMRKVVSYVKRHLKQGGPDDKDAVKDSPWRYSLMNWGHDPLKD